MVLLAGTGNEISKVYVKQLYRLTDQMSEEIRSVFKRRANLIREDLSVLGSVNPGLIDLSSITAGPWKGHCLQGLFSDEVEITHLQEHN